MSNKPLQDIVADYVQAKAASMMGIIGNDSALVWSIVGKTYDEEGAYDVLGVIPREIGEKTNIQSPAPTLEEIAKIIPGELRVDFSRRIVGVDFWLPETVVEKAPDRIHTTGRIPKNTDPHIVKKVSGLYHIQYVWGPYPDLPKAASAAMWCMIEIEKKKRAIA